MEIRPEQECSLESHIMQHDNTLLLLSKIHPLISIIQCLRLGSLSSSPRAHTPLALICSLLRLLQFLQSCGEPLLSAIQFLFHQLNAPVQRSDVRLGLHSRREKAKKNEGGGEDINESSTFIHHKAQWTPHLD